MDSGSTLVPIATLVLGSVLTYLIGWLHDRTASKREDAREARANDARRAAAGREHAATALGLIRSADDAISNRPLDRTSHDIDLDGLGLETAAAEIDLIPDPLLRPRLSSVLSAVRFPHTLANSSYSEGYPFETQRRGLWLVRTALGAYVREEPTTIELDALGLLAKANDDAHREDDEARADWERQERNQE